MKHHGKQQQFALVHFIGEPGQERQLFPERSLPEPDDLFHCKQRMYIDRIDVVEVVLDLAVNPLEFRNETDQELQVVHQLEGLGDPLVGAEDVEK